MSENPSTATGATHWRITLVALGLLALLAMLTKHHAMQKPEHVGMFAGSLLQRSDWDH